MLAVIFGEMFKYLQKDRASTLNFQTVSTVIQEPRTWLSQSVKYLTYVEESDSKNGPCIIAKHQGVWNAVFFRKEQVRSKAGIRNCSFFSFENMNLYNKNLFIILIS